MNTNKKSQITALLFSEFVKSGLQNEHDDFYVVMENQCLIFQSWHKETALTQICMIEENEIDNIRSPAAYIEKNTITHKTDGN